MALDIRNMLDASDADLRTIAGWLCEEFPYDKRYDLSVEGNSIEKVVALLRDRKTSLVAYLGGRLIGTNGLVDHDDLTDPRVVDLTPWFTDFVIANGERGKGHGTELEAAMVAYAREQGVRKLYLYTDDGSDQEKFYTKRGWTPLVVDGEEVRYVHNDEAIVVMERDL